jgi:hypothetical protein
VSLILFHILLQLLPALYIPVLSSQLSSANCSVHYIQAIDGLESDTSNACHNSLLLRILNVISFIVFIPAFFFSVSTFYEWRPDQPNMCGKSHARYDVLVYSGIFFSVIFTSFLEQFVVSIFGL